MLQVNEIVTLLLGAGAWLFLYVNRPRLKLLPCSYLLFVSYHALLAGWILTVLEGLFLEETLNFVEHLCYMTSSILMALWCRNALGAKADSQ